MKILFGANSRNRNIGPEQNFSNLILFSEMSENRLKLKKALEKELKHFVFNFNS